MGRKILIICVCILCLAGAAVFVSQMAEPPVETGKVVRDPVTEHCIIISAEYESVEAMNLAASTDGVPEGGYVLISSNVEDPDNAKLFIKGAEGYKFVTDLSGAKGKDGAAGQAGVTPLVKINADSGEWEVSYDSGTSWESLGVQAQGSQGPQGDKGDKGDKGATGATGPQGPAYVLTDADKQAIINAVLAQLGNGDSGDSGDSGGDSTDLPDNMYVQSSDGDSFYETSEVSTSHKYLHKCTYCGAWLFSNDSSGPNCCPAPCENIDGYYDTVDNPYRVIQAYYAENADSEWYESPQGGMYDYVWHSDCGAVLYVSDSMSTYVMSCPHCGDSHEVMWGSE